MRGTFGRGRARSAGRWALAAVGVLAIVLSAGCGGGGSSLTKSQFIEKAASICEQANHAQSAALQRLIKEKELKGKSGAERERTVLAAGLAPLTKEIQELKAMGAPKGDQEEVATIVEELEAGIREAEKAGQYKALESVFVTVNGRMEKYGLKGCSAP